MQKNKQCSYLIINKKILQASRNFFISSGFSCPQFLPLFNDKTTAGQKPQSEALMGRNQKLPVDKVQSGVNMTGQTFGVQAATRDCIYRLGHSTV